MEEQTMRFSTSSNSSWLVLTVVLFAAACGNGDSTTKTETDEDDGAHARRDGGEVEGTDSGTGPTDDGGDDAGLTCPASCDDEVDCTDDQCENEECQHLTLHGRCRPGSVCDAEQGCVSPPACASVADCPDLDGPCLQESCNTATATCAYAPLDADADGHSPQICATVGGDDCDDSVPWIYPGAEEVCDGNDNDCDGEMDNISETCEPAGNNQCSQGSECSTETGKCVCWENAECWRNEDCVEGGPWVTTTICNQGLCIEPVNCDYDFDCWEFNPDWVCDTFQLPGLCVESVSCSANSDCWEFNPDWVCDEIHEGTMVCVPHS